MANSRLRYNDLRTTLANSLTNSGTTITFTTTLKHSNGTNVPTIAGGDVIPLCLLDAVTGELLEIVYLTAYTAAATTGTITRGQEGTSGVTHAANETVVCAPTVADFAAAWLTPSYDTGWADWSDSTNELFRYRKVGNRVTLTGLCRRTSGATAQPTTLPAGFRPSRTTWGFATVNGAAGTCNITNGGVVTITNPAVVTNQFVAVHLEFETDQP